MLAEGAKAIPIQVDWKNLQAMESVPDKAVHYQSMSLLSMVQEVPGNADYATDDADVEKMLPASGLSQPDNKSKQGISAFRPELDIFKAAWQVVSALLRDREPMTEKEIIEQLEKYSPIVKKQVELWLKKAVEDGLAVKHNRPVRYSLK